MEGTRPTPQGTTCGKCAISRDGFYFCAYRLGGRCGLMEKMPAGEWSGPAGVPSPRPLGSSSYRAPIQSSRRPPARPPRPWWRDVPPLVLVALALVAALAWLAAAAMSAAAVLLVHYALSGR